MGRWAAVWGTIVCLGCPDRWIEEPPRPEVPPACGPGFRLDPSTGECIERGCRSDDDCLPEQRCEPIEAACIPRETPETLAALDIRRTAGIPPR